MAFGCDGLRRRDIASKPLKCYNKEKYQHQPLRFPFQKHTAGERRLIPFSSSERKRLEEELDAFNQGESADIKTSREAAAFDNASKKEAWEAVIKSQRTTGEIFSSLLFHPKDVVKNLLKPDEILVAGINRTMSSRIDELAKARVEKMNQELKNSNMKALQKLEQQYRGQDLKQEIAQERVAIAKEMLEVIDAKMAAIQKDIEYFSSLRGLTKSMGKQMNMQQERLEETRRYLADILGNTEQKVAEYNEENGDIVAKAEMTDNAIRGQVLKMIDLNDPNSQEILRSLDHALLKAAAGKSDDLEQIVATLQSGKKVRPVDAAFLSQLLKNYAENPAGAARLARSQARARMKANDGDSEARMKTMAEELPLGQHVNMRGEECVVISKNKETNTIIMRMPGSEGVMYALSTKAENGTYACIRKSKNDAAGKFCTVSAKKTRDKDGKPLKGHEMPDTLYFYTDFSTAP